jgi:DNA-directed RNA polymerase specialized sigma24 family protein
LRSYLLTSLKNFLGKAHRRAMTVKRGQDQPLVPLEELLARERADLEPADTLSAQEYRVANNATLFDELKQVLGDEPDRPSQAVIGRKLGMTENAVKQAFHRLRKRYRALLREEIVHTVAVPGDVEDELRHFISVLQT